MEAQSEYIYIFAHFCTFGADFYAQSVLIKNFFLHRSSRKSFLKVRCWLGSFLHPLQARKREGEKKLVEMSQVEKNCCMVGWLW